MLDHMLSIHVRSRVFATLDDAAQFIKSVSMLYDAYVETKNVGMLKVQPASAITTYTYVIGTINCVIRFRLYVYLGQASKA